MRTPFLTLTSWLAASVSLACGAPGAFADTLPVVESQAWASKATLILPQNETTLQVVARETGESPNPLTYRWLKVGGPPMGNVVFSPNGGEDAHATRITFTRPVPGRYTFRVIVGNALGETISEVDVLIEPGAGARQSAVTSVPDYRDAGDERARPAAVLVRFEVPRADGPALSAASRAALVGLGAEIVKVWMQGRLGLIELPPGADVDAALAVLEALSEIRYAVEDDPVKLDERVPNDPLFPSQWPLETASDADLDAPLAWEQSTGSGQTLVAVMDTGIDYTHPDLYLALAINEGEIPPSLLGAIVDTNGNGLVDFYDLNSLDENGDVVLDGSGERLNSSASADQNANGYIDAGDLLGAPWSDGADGDGNGFVDDLTGWDHLTATADVMDTHGHGTHVAGIIGARGDNAIGIAGVNWRARILPEKFHSGDGGTISGAIASIEHAVLAGAKIINASWGTSTNNPALKDAVGWAGDNGVIVVVAAGNQSNDIDIASVAYYPAAYADLPNLLSVASVDPDGGLSSYSNYGYDSVDLAAPGASVLSTGIGGTYVHWSGTSMAAPHVSGVLSLLTDTFPGKSPDWVAEQVLSSVKLVPDLAVKVRSGGIVDAFTALDSVIGAGPRVIAANPAGDVQGLSDYVQITFDRAIAASTFSVADVEIDGPAGSIAPTAVVAVSDVLFEVQFALQALPGTYTVRVGPQIADTFGSAMDQDRDGNAGEPLDDRYSVVFRQLPPPPATWIVDNGDAGYAASGAWNTYTGVGSQGDFAYKPVGSGSAMATWSLGGLAPGQYRVSVTWEAYTNRAANAGYTVIDDAAALGTVVVDQREIPADFVEDGVHWQDLGVYQVTSDTLRVRLTDLAGPPASYVVADAVRIEYAGEPTYEPEIEIRVDGTPVSDGTGSVGFGDTIVGEPVNRTITVVNAGTAELTLGAITLPAGFSLVDGPGATSLAPGQTESLVVQLDALLEGTYSGVFVIESNDADEDPFEFAISGTVSPWTPPAPDIEIRVDGDLITDGVSSVTFGTTVIGDPVSRTVTIRNAGTANLTIGTIALPNGFSLTAGISSAVLEPGQIDNFVVQLDALLDGAYAGTVLIESNDPDESPFDFAVSATVTAQEPAPAVTIIDDGGAGYAAAGGWSTYVGVGAEGDFAYKPVGSGAVATWTASGLTPGQYIVSVTWEPYTNRAANAPYTVLDGSVALATVAVDQRQPPLGFEEDSVSWQDLGVFSITGDTLNVRLEDAAGPSGSYIVADAVRIERVGELPHAPEIEIRVDGTPVADGTGTADFGSTPLGTAVARTITVRNVGMADLTLGAITVPSGFSVVSGPGSTVLVPGQSDTFVVQLDALLEGDFSGTLTLASNDGDESPFDFAIFGTVSAQESSQITVVDDGDTGYVATGGWNTYVGAGAEGDFAYKSVGSGAATATWTVNGLAPGEYRVSVTWEPYSNRAADATYTVLDGSVDLGTVAVDQRLSPNGFDENGIHWQDLGNFQITGNTISIQLSDLASPSGSYIVADAVRIERVGELTFAPEIEVRVDGALVADGTGSADFGSTPLGTPVSRTIAVRNAGTVDLALGTIGLPAGFSLVSSVGSTLLVPGQTESFVVQLDASFEGTYSGTLGIDSNDGDESPFDFTISGTVTVTGSGPEIAIVDDGGAGYTATGSWNTYGGVGAGSDFAYKQVGTGATATWTATGLTPGRYRVSVTWEPYTNRTIDAPYTVLDGAAELGTVTIDQRYTPVGFEEDGLLWQDLGVYEITGTTLSVRLTDSSGPSGSYVIADAIRIELTQ